MIGTSSEFLFPVAAASLRAAVQAITRTSSPDDCGNTFGPAIAHLDRWWSPSGRLQRPAWSDLSVQRARMGLQRLRMEA